MERIKVFGRSISRDEVWRIGRELLRVVCRDEREIRWCAELVDLWGDLIAEVRVLRLGMSVD